MKIAVLAPTFGRGPALLANCVACFEAQTWPEARMLIYDDGGHVPEGEGERWVARQRPGGRAPSLPAKYNEMVAWFGEWPDAFAVWDTDDVYLPDHLERIAQALASSPWAHPVYVWSTYAGGSRAPELEAAAGRFHGSLAVRREALAAIGGWPETLRADFDQQILTRLRERFGPPADPSPERPTYVFRWADTGEPHCQGLMSSPDNSTWYQRVDPGKPWPAGAKLESAFDASAVEIMAALGDRCVSREKSPRALRFVRTADLARDAAQLAGQIPQDVAAIAGVPRSGMLAAAIVATHLNLPLWSWRPGRELAPLGGGERVTVTQWLGRVAIVDDSICTGHVIRAARRELPNAWFGAVYATPRGRAVADGWAVALDEPHLFEWNLLNSGFVDGSGAPWPWLAGGIALDFDGVLCHDCPTGADGDDTPAGDARYLQWLSSAAPKHLPRRSVVPLVVSFRLQRFAAESLAWAERYGVRVAEWVFHPAATFAERARTFDVAAHKGEAFARSRAGLFVESDCRQAPAIAARAGKPVVALDSGEVFQG